MNTFEKVEEFFKNQHMAVSRFYVCKFCHVDYDSFKIILKKLLEQNKIEEIINSAGRFYQIKNGEGN
jgi:hypothetical protein